MLQQYETRSNTSPPHTTYRHGVGKKFLGHVGRILESDISIIPEFLQCVNIGSFVGYLYPTKACHLK